MVTFHRLLPEVLLIRIRNTGHLNRQEIRRIIIITITGIRRRHLCPKQRAYMNKYTAMVRRRHRPQPHSISSRWLQRWCLRAWRIQHRIVHSLALRPQWWIITRNKLEVRRRHCHMNRVYQFRRNWHWPPIDKNSNMQNGCSRPIDSSRNRITVIDLIHIPLSQTNSAVSSSNSIINNSSNSNSNITVNNNNNNNNNNNSSSYNKGHSIYLLFRPLLTRALHRISIIYRLHCNDVSVRHQITFPLL